MNNSTAVLVILEPLKVILGQNCFSVVFVTCSMWTFHFMLHFTPCQFPYKNAKGI